MNICDKSCYQSSACKIARLMTSHVNIHLDVDVRRKIVLWKTLQQFRISLLYHVRTEMFYFAVMYCLLMHGVVGQMRILIHSGFAVVN